MIEVSAGERQTLMLTPYDACPLCDSKGMNEFARGDCLRHETYQQGLPRIVIWLRCAACGHVFRNGYFEAGELRSVLSQTMHMQTVGSQYEAARTQMERTIDLVLPFVDDGIWLDVGFGDGALLRTAKEFGFLPLGIDLRESNVEALRRLGIPAYCVDLEQLQADPPCRVLSMQYVLAHLPFPRLALAAARRVLAKDGVLVISTPNIESGLWQEWETAGVNPYWGEIECCHHFGKTRLYALLAEQGFEPVRYTLGLRYRCCMEIIARKRSGSGQVSPHRAL